jgi:DNA-binding MarR family transcriptional regulator
LLVERGWVVRAPDPSDRRQSMLLLTDPGRKHYEHASEQATQRLKPLMAQLRPDELAAVRMALPALRRVLTQEEEDASDER